MSFNSFKDLGSDMILGDVVAQNITCQTITIEDAGDENLTAKSLVADDKKISADRKYRRF